MEPNSIEKIVEIDTHIGKKTEWILAINYTENLNPYSYWWNNCFIGLKWEWVSLAILAFWFLMGLLTNPKM